MANNKIEYPLTRQVEHVDNYHGNEVKDPYRWLENDARTSEEVAQWCEAQSHFTKEYLKQIPDREKILQRVKDLYKFERVNGAHWEGGKLFFSFHDGVRNHPVHYVADGYSSDGQVILDPNALSEDGSVSVSSVVPSPNAARIAYSVSDSGSDWQIIRLRDLETGCDLQDEIKYVKFSGISWTSDSMGFFYCRFPAPDEDAVHQQLNLNHELYYHRIGTHQNSDVLAYHRNDHPEYVMYGDVSKDGRFLVIHFSTGATPNHGVAIRDLSEPYGLPMEVVPDVNNEYNFIESADNLLYFMTDLDAPRKRLIAIDIRKPERSSWKEIIPEKEDTLETAYLVNGIIVAVYLTDAHSTVHLHKLDGQFIRQLELPGIGTAHSFHSAPGIEFLYMFSSFESPPRTYRYDLLTNQSQLWRQPKLPFNPDDFQTTQIFVTSKDGTRVPAFVTSRKSIKLDGSNPTILYGYGGFNISETPSFSVTSLAWCEMGNIWVTANLRGGGEYGEEWHKAGQREKKQNVFDDFIAIGEYLIEHRYTSSDRLAIYGGSNGGLLVGSVMHQRPELFAAAVAEVGVMDMLRFDKFTAGKYWVDEYGSADKAEEEFKWLYAYSPYHCILRAEPNSKLYPATLIVTADTDDRVVPSHSFKFGAALQQYNQQRASTGEGAFLPLALLRIETKAGHGAGAPTSKKIVKESDKLAFVLDAFSQRAKNGGRETNLNN